MPPPPFLHDTSGHHTGSDVEWLLALSTTTVAVGVLLLDAAWLWHDVGGRFVNLLPQLPPQMDTRKKQRGATSRRCSVVASLRRCLALVLAGFLLWVLFPMAPWVSVILPAVWGVGVEWLQVRLVALSLSLSLSLWPLGACFVLWW